MKDETATLERTVMTCRADMWRTVCEDAILECGIEEERFGPVQATVFEALPDAQNLNLVLGAAEPGAVEEGHLAAALGWMDGFDVDYRVTVARHRPGWALAEDYLNHEGFEQGRGLMKYVRDTSPPDRVGDPNIKVWEIGQEEFHGEMMSHDAALALGLPSPAGSLLFSLPLQDHWRSYTVQLEGTIVSFGSMLLNDGIAWLGLDATVEEARGRGCNQILLRERILVAAESGCHTIFTELEEDGSEGVAAAGRNLLRAGFVPAYRSMNWQHPRFGPG